VAVSLSAAAVGADINDLRLARMQRQTAKAKYRDLRAATNTRGACDRDGLGRTARS
jgi:hypothetical protein